MRTCSRTWCAPTPTSVMIIGGDGGDLGVSHRDLGVVGRQLKMLLVLCGAVVAPRQSEDQRIAALKLARSLPLPARPRLRPPYFSLQPASWDVFPLKQLSSSGCLVHGWPVITGCLRTVSAGYR